MVGTRLNISSHVIPPFLGLLGSLERVQAGREAMMNNGKRKSLKMHKITQQTDPQGTNLIQVFTTERMSTKARDLDLFVWEVVI